MVRRLLVPLLSWNYLRRGPANLFILLVVILILILTFIVLVLAVEVGIIITYYNLVVDDRINIVLWSRKIMIVFCAG